MKFNRKVDSIFLNGPLAIDLAFGERSLRSYLHELDLIERGVPFSELGIKERKAAQEPRIITQDDDGGHVEVHFDDEDEFEIPRGSIARLYLNGVMRSDDRMSSYGIHTMTRWIERLSNDPAIDGILMEVNSGGGELTAGQMLLAAIEACSVPIVAWCHFCGSAALMGTLPCDEIIASNQYSEFGSIGTMISVNDKLVRWYKKNVNEIYSTKSPDKRKAWREYLNGDQSLLVQDATKFDELFMQDVRKHRSLRGDIEETLSGAMFSAEDARARGLIDGIGDLNYALRRLTSHIRFHKQQNKR